MTGSIEEQNRKFIIDWIEKNPNFSGHNSDPNSSLNFYDNTIIFGNGKTIKLGNFLVSSLLNNPSIGYNIYSMNQSLFYQIMYANTGLYDYYVSNDLNPEYVEKIELTTWGTSYIITNKNKNNKNAKNDEINEVKPSELLLIYRSLKEKYNNYVPVSDLYKKINKVYISNEKKDIIFFDLINKDEVLSQKDTKYINDFSNYMYTALCYQDYLVGDAKNCFDLYRYRMNNLIRKNNLNENQKIALKCYETNLEAFELKQKEASYEMKASLGFSSLALIIVSVVVTLSLIVLLIVIH